MALLKKTESRALARLMFPLACLLLVVLANVGYFLPGTVSISWSMVLIVSIAAISHFRKLVEPVYAVKLVLATWFFLLVPVGESVVWLVPFLPVLFIFVLGASKTSTVWDLVEGLPWGVKVTAGLYFLLRVALLVFSGGGLWSLLSIGAEPLVALAALFIWAILRNERGAVKHLVEPWLWALGALTVYALFLSLESGKGAPYPFFSNANYLSAAVCMALPFGVWLAFAEQGWRRSLYGGLSVLLVVGLVWFQSRGAWVGLGGGLALACLVLVPSNKLRVVLGLAGGMTLIALLWWANQSVNRSAPEPSLAPLASIVDTEDNFSNRERLMRWELAWRMAGDRPWAGFGNGTFPVEFKYYLKNKAEVERISYWNGWSGAAHSEYLTRLAELGIPVGVLFVLWVLVTLALVFRKVNRGIWDRKWGALLMAAFGSWVIHGVFNDLSLDRRIWVMVCVLVLVISDSGKAPRSANNVNGSSSPNGS